MPMASHCLRVATLLLFSAVLTGIVSAAAADTTDSTALEEALVRVDELRDDGEFRKALSELHSLRGEHGDHVGLLWRASFTRVDLGKMKEGGAKSHYQKALDLAEKALAADSSSAHSHLAKAVAEGRLALDAGTKERVQRSRAIERHANQAIALDSSLASAYHVRARWNREVSDLNFFERTVVKTVYGGLPEASFEQSVRDFTRAIELDNQRFHHLELAKTYRKMDRPKQAKEELQTVLSLPPKDAFAERYKEEAEELLEELE